MDDAIRHLASSALFGGLDETVLRLLAEDAFVRDVEAGETLFEPGDARTDLFLVLAGRLEIRSRELREAGEIVLLGPGECVGEAGLLEPGVHTGAATANHPATLLQVPLLPVRQRMAADGKAAIAICTAVA